MLPLSSRFLVVFGGANAGSFMFDVEENAFRGFKPQFADFELDCADMVQLSREHVYIRPNDEDGIYKYNMRTAMEVDEAMLSSSSSEESEEETGEPKKPRVPTLEELLLKKPEFADPKAIEFWCKIQLLSKHL